MNTANPPADGTGAVEDPHTGTVPLPEEAPPPIYASAPDRRRFSWQRFGGKFLVLSVAAHILFFAAAAYFIVQRVQAQRKLTFASGPKGPNASTRALEHKVQQKKQKMTQSAPPQAKRVTTTGISKVALPDMPAMPTMTATLSPGAVSGMGAGGLSPGGLGGGVGGMGGNGGAAINFFGVRTGGVGLKGTFYDLKQTGGKQPTNMTPPQYGQIILQFIKGGFNTGILNRFYKSDKPLYATSMWIPQIKADEGPAAFQLQGVVQPKMWCAFYKGIVTPPVSMTFHFVGAGDDVMAVKFNGKLVLERNWYERSGWKEQANYDYNFSGIKNGFAKGDTIKVEAGQKYPIEIIIGEQPGGDMYALLMQEVEGVEYEKVGNNGPPILPVFRMSNAKPAASSANAKFPPHRDDGPVWKGEPESSSTTGSFSVFDH